MLTNTDSQLLGINSPWEIYDVELKVDESRLDIWIEYMDDKGASPECGAALSVVQCSLC